MESTMNHPADIRSFVRPHMLAIYPALAGTRIDYGWGGTLAITLRRMPAFGKLARNIHYALGYSGHGIPTATLAGKLLAEAIAGHSEGFDVMARIQPRASRGARCTLSGHGAGAALLRAA
jgi:gamma-glutamylputrescine oxidase